MPLKLVYLSMLCALFSTLYISPALSQQSYEEWLKQDQQEFDDYEAEVTKAYGKYLEEEAAAFNAFIKTAGEKWGKDNVWIPEKTTWVQYREDWEERSSVQFENGIAQIEVIVAENATEEEINKAVANAVESLVLSGSISPIEMMRRKLFPSRYKKETRDQRSKSVASRLHLDNEPCNEQSSNRIQQKPSTQYPAPSPQYPVPSPPPINYRPKGNQMPPPYIVKQGDSLWKIARRFDVSRKKIATINGLDPNSGINIGQELYIPYKTKRTHATTPSMRLPPGGARHSESGAYSQNITKQNMSPKTPPNSQRRDGAPLAGLAGVAKRKQLQPRGVHHPEASPDPRLASNGKDPLLHRQLKMPDGTAVTQNNARKFAEHIATTQKPTSTTVTGGDGKQRRTIKTQFPLVPDHVRIRAERFRPIVTKYADQEGVYAPMVYAIIHSESSFNPRARSGVPAYGLMQLVPRSGARDAYRYVHKKDKLVSGSYLYNPENNIELGVAFLHILDQRYFRRVENPMNRMLCSIAAYNTGAGNVCKAFGAGTSLSRAAPIINRMEPAEVYAKLHRDLPYAETRHYIKKVTDRIPLYKAWK